MKKTSLSNRLRTGDWWAATKEDCSAPWNGGKGGIYFRCGFCGHKFVVGESVKWLYTNDIVGAGGNPFVCNQCGGNVTTENLRKDWLEHCNRAKTEYWFFTRID